METITTSQKYTLDKKDFLRGLLISVLSPVFTIAIQSLNDGSLTFDWKAMTATGLSAGLAYLLKNFLTPSTITVKAEKEMVQSVKDGETEIKLQTKN